MLPGLMFLHLNLSWLLMDVLMAAVRTHHVTKFINWFLSRDGELTVLTVHSQQLYSEMQGRDHTCAALQQPRDAAR